VSRRAADAIIIGGGITGVSTAFQLAGLGLRRVLVLEKKFVGAGGTGRSVGIIRQLYPTRETSEMVLRSLAIFERFGDAVAGASASSAPGFSSASPRPCGPPRRPSPQRSVGVRAEIVERRSRAHRVSHRPGGLAPISGSPARATETLPR
jgi:glycine/D-amino acid oxidase-like deaminating enzyme